MKINNLFAVGIISSALALAGCNGPTSDDTGISKVSFVGQRAVDDGSLDLADAIHTLQYIFVFGPPPAVPFPHCGWDPTPGGDLDCGVPTGSCP